MRQRAPLAVCLYRSLLQWTRAHAKGPPFVVSAAEVASAMGAVTPVSAVEDAAGVARVVRAAFRDDAALPRGSEAAGEAVDRAFGALRYVNDTLTPVLEKRAAARAAHADRTGVLYPLGTTFRHKRYGYTGVVVGWDRRCERPPVWQEAFAASLDHGAAQPFYTVLPDQRDCIALFGGAREQKYVAQENMEPLFPVAPAAPGGAPAPAPRGLGGIGRRARIVHPDLPRFFLGFCRTAQRYVPRRELAYEYGPEEEGDPAASLDALELL